MPITFIPDSAGYDYQDGFEKHYYEKQVPPSGPFGSTAFQLAAARAKDKARHKLVQRVRAERDKVRQSRGIIEDVGMILSGDLPSKTDIKMTIDGAPASSEDAIKP